MKPNTRYAIGSFSIVAGMILAIILLAGCVTYKQAGVVAVTAETAMTAWADYFDAAIKDPPAFNTTAAKLWKSRQDVDKGWGAYRIAMNAVDDTRIAGGDVKAALAVASSKSSELTAAIISLLPDQYKPRN